MIHDHQRIVVDVKGFPQFRRHAQVIKASRRVGSRREPVAWNLEPLFSLVNSRDDLRIDAQSQRWRPRRRILDVADPLPIPREQHRAGAFQSLFGQDRLVSLQFKLRLHRAVRPDDSRDIGLSVLAQPEVENWGSYDLLLCQQAGADFDLAADAEGVDALVTGGFGGAGADGLAVVILRAAIDELDGLTFDGVTSGKPGSRSDPDEFQSAVAVRVKEGDFAISSYRIQRSEFLLSFVEENLHIGS